MEEYKKQAMLQYFEKNFRENIEEEQLLQFEDMEKYKVTVSASKIGAAIGGCPYKLYMEAKHPIQHSFKQLRIFQRGHIGEQTIGKFFKKDSVKKQLKIINELNNEPMVAHLDFLLGDSKKHRIFEVKTTEDVKTVQENWKAQIIFQMGMYMEEVGPDVEVEGYIIATNVQNGELEIHEIEFDDEFFGLCLIQAEYLQDMFAGRRKPIAIIQHYCSSCQYKMECPAAGLLATQATESIKKDLEIIKNAAVVKKEAEQAKKRVTEHMVNFGQSKIKDDYSRTVAMLGETSTSRFDLERFKECHPELYKEFLKETPSYRLNVI